MHVALRRPRSAQASNDRITFVSALDQRNKRGYDVLLFRPPAQTGQKARAVTLYEGQWHELDHDARTRRPYLGIERLDIHEFDGESLPSDNEPIPESSDEEPAAPRPKSEDSSDSSDGEPTQRYAPSTQQEPLSPTASVTSQIWRLRLLQLQQQRLLSDLTPHQSTPLPLHRLPPQLHNELQVIYKLLYGEPLEDLADLAALETLADLADPEAPEDQDNQEELLLFQPPQPLLLQPPTMTIDLWAVYPRHTREIESSPEHFSISLPTTSEQIQESQD
jgi:hypothetical protein